MRITLAIVVPLAAALIQSAIAPLISIAGAFPHLPLLAAASWSVAVGAGEGLWWAFVGGLALDVLSAGPLGAFTVSALPGTLMVGIGDRSAARPIPVLTGVAAVFLAVLLTQVLYLGILSLLGHPSVSAGPALFAQTVGVGIYTGALALVVYPLARAGRRLTEQESPF